MDNHDTSQGNVQKYPFYSHKMNTIYVYFYTFPWLVSWLSIVSIIYFRYVCICRLGIHMSHIRSLGGIWRRTRACLHLEMGQNRFSRPSVVIIDPISMKLWSNMYIDISCGYAKFDIDRSRNYRLLEFFVWIFQSRPHAVCVWFSNWDYHFHHMQSISYFFMYIKTYCL